MSDYGKDALKRLLLRIDEEAYLELGILSPRPKIVIAGGSALLLSDLTARMVTYNVDKQRYLEMRDLYINYAREHGHEPKF